MLFSVKYINTNIEDFHNVLIYFFRQLETNNHTIFSDNLFPPECREKLYKYGNPANGYKKFIDSFKNIFDIYSSTTITAENKQKIVDDFFSCNEIDEICNDISKSPLHYDDMDVEEKKVANFFNSFYDSFFDSFVDKQQHFDDFIFENGKICSICGMNTIYQYDHFIPKGTQFPIYPFSSVNPKNLIPVCQGCNGPKSSKLIIYENSDKTNTRLLTFSPYYAFETWQNLDFEITNIVKPEVNSSGKWSIKLTPKDNGLTTEQIAKINRWKDFYKIEERFSKEIENGMKIWIGEFQFKGKTFTEMITETEPNFYNIRRINSILLQNLLFQFIVANNEIMELFSLEENTSEDPNNLLMEQEGN